MKKRDIKRLSAARIFLRSLLGITRLDCQKNRDVIENSFQELTVKLKTVQELTKKRIQNEDKYNTKLENEVETDMLNATTEKGGQPNSTKKFVN